jgi:hypothetical protein
MLSDFDRADAIGSYFEEALSLYEWLLYAHLLGVGLLLAGLGAHAVSVERLRRSETTRELAALMSTSELGTKLVLIGGPLLIAAGLTMAIRSWSLTDGWIATAIALVRWTGGTWVDRRSPVEGHENCCSGGAEGQAV